jgi:hypothetical protein
MSNDQINYLILVVFLLTNIFSFSPSSAVMMKLLVIYYSILRTALPSEADKNITYDLKKILEIISVKLVEHIVVTTKDTYSFAEYNQL